MRNALLFFIFIGMYLSAEENNLQVGEVTFDGNKMHLSGDFTWEHSLGKIQAKSAEACFDPTQNPWHPNEITLQEGLEIEMKDGSVLSSPYARLDCKQWVGIFHGHAGHKITFEKGSEGVFLKSLRMELTFVPPSSDRFVGLERLVADGSVEIGMESDLRLSGERAVFDEFSSKGAFGHASLQANTADARCHISQNLSEGMVNTISSISAEINLRDRTAILEDPEGVLEKKGPPLRFKAKQMRINKLEEQLILEPPVRIEWLGVLESSGRVEISQNKKELQKVLVQGPSQLTWKTPIDGIEHHLTVHGLLSVDPILKKVDMLSPGVSEESQVFFRDAHGEIYADKVTLDYAESEGAVSPVKMVLTGNVRIQNKKIGTQQYALADEAVFEFEKNTLSLKAKKRPNVLFYDELNKIQASAPGLVINRDPASGKEVVRGIGKVRFIFAEDELNELKKRFSFESKK
jgi:lipopolysaccharide export system protein LptA